MLFIHEDTREYIFAVNRRKIHVKAKIASKNTLKCKIIYWNRFFKQDVLGRSMKCVGTDSTYSYYEVDLDFTDTAQYMQYYFEVADGTKTVFCGRNGLEYKKPEYYFEYLATAELDITEVPEWANGTIWYQIFPERFCNGQTENDPIDVQPWGTVPTRENHFGGDLRGIINKLPYLQELGVDVLYLTPIFTSPSNHKYDTTDYFTIDPSFGTEQDLIELVKKCHDNGMKVILDGVFNHIGYFSKQFQDVVKNGKESQYADWFYINSYPIETEPLNYECVGYYKWMPKLRYKTRAVRDYILNVGKYWIEKADIDGWRLDVADEVDFTFWQEFRREIKTVKPDAFLLAETWKDGRDMLRGDQMDSVMNYLFRDAVVDFFARRVIDAETFTNRISRMLLGYSKVNRLVLYNAIGSHDTPRFLTLCGMDKQKLKLAAAFQMTFTGMPAIYYGDEIGMYGENDPDCRKTMEWENADTDLLALYQYLAKVHKERISLRLGDLKFVYNQDNVIAYVRKHESEITGVIINNSDRKQVVQILFPEEFEMLLDNHTMSVEIDPFQFKVLEIS